MNVRWALQYPPPEFNDGIMKIYLVDAPVEGGWRRVVATFLLHDEEYAKSICAHLNKEHP